MGGSDQAGGRGGQAQPRQGRKRGTLRGTCPVHAAPSCRPCRPPPNPAVAAHCPTCIRDTAPRTTHHPHALPPVSATDAPRARGFRNVVRRWWWELLSPRLMRPRPPPPPVQLPRVDLEGLMACVAAAPWGSHCSLVLRLTSALLHITRAPLAPVPEHSYLAGSARRS